MRLLVVSLLVRTLATAAPALADGGDSPLRTDVMPVFQARCVKCHGPLRAKAKLNLSTARGVARGGENGALIDSEDPSASLLWEKLSNDEMPPKEPLSAEEKTAIKRWIFAGAPGLPAISSDQPASEDHWAFARLRKPDPPAIATPAAARSPIDRFLLAALDENRLSYAAEADRHTLIRRVAIDLTGLPPTPSEIDAFIHDQSLDAYERMVDRFLASPRYGERWGKLWLDAAGYADSNGHFSADSDRPLAYRYRDYVIQCFNEDKPLDQFLVEQLAGDELVGYRGEAIVSNVTRDALIATGFLRTAQDGTGESDGNPDEVRADQYAVLEGTVQILGSSLFGMTFQCARCHDHKFEPITQRDYYNLMAVFAHAYNLSDWTKPNDRVARASTLDELAEWETHAVDSWSGGDGGNRHEALNKIAWICESPYKSPPFYILKRGNYGDRGDEAVPSGPGFLTDGDNAFQPESSGAAAQPKGRRLALARWLTKPGSRPAALLARVTANRIWQGHFGAGIVATPDNLGLSGTPPTHPELLEYLAAEFADSGWRWKPIHRRILLSAVYRQSSRVDPRVLGRDPDNRWLGRFPMRRLDAEAIRDGQLATSGELDQSMFGPFIATQRTGVGEVVVAESAGGSHRRSLYLQQRRTQILSMLDVFDAPSIVTNCTRRNVATIPIQSLSLLNSEFLQARARSFAARLAREAGSSPASRIDHAFLLATGRPPDQSRKQAALRFLAEQPARYAPSPDSAELAWRDFCHMLLSSNEFIYVE